MRIVLTLLAACFFCTASVAQKTRQELEKENQQYKKEMQELEKLAKENKNQTAQTYTAVKLQANKIAIQEKVINNISNDINLLDNNIYTIQKDINRYDRILDTLKQEYAKSMVYAYKNRSNYDFLNFVFSANSFNDAVKRIAYLKSYREYREMQGENILRTQELRKQRIEQITGVKRDKSKVLEVKSSEVDDLAKQKAEQDRKLAELKKNAGQIAARYAEKKKQMNKIISMIAAIRKEEIRKAKEAAKIAAAEKARKRKEEEDRIRKQKEADRLAAIKSGATPKTDPVVKAPKTERVKVEKTEPEKSEFPAEYNIATSGFKNSKGSLPWPVSSGHILLHYGRNELGGNNIIVFDGISIGTDVGTPVKCIKEGVVSAVQSIDGDAMVVLVRHGEYFTSYSNIGGVSVRQGQQVSAGQVLGKVLRNLDGVGAVDFMISDEKGEKDPQQWLQRR